VCLDTSFTCCELEKLDAVKFAGVVLQFSFCTAKPSLKASMLQGGSDAQFMTEFVD
jgi:hypothetical protein